MLLGSVLIIGHFELLDLMFHLHPIDVNLILHAIKLVIPPTGYIFLLNHRLGCILSQFLVSWTIFVDVQGSSHTPLEVLEIIGHKVEPISFEQSRVKLENCILQATCAESNHWCARAEEFVLHDTSRFEH